MESPSPPGRLRSVDIARGLAMVLMVVDHVRVYAGVPAGGPDPATFLTRWITHFCAPTFVFLAGTSAFLGGQRRTRAALSRRLLLRGLWLVVLELTVLKVCWTFQFDYRSVLAGVIWVLGWSMVVLAGLVWLPLPVTAAFGLLVVFGHDASSAWFAPRAGTRPGPWLTLLHGIGGFPLGKGWPVVMVLYALVPWVGVMACGYAFGRVLERAPERRTRSCLLLGSAAVALFVLLRATGLYGDPRPFTGKGATPWMEFIETTKYPASLCFLLMTLGPLLLLLPAFERSRGRAASVLATFGRVPMAFYLMHIPLIHALALLVALVRTPDHLGWLFAPHPMGSPPVPEGYRWSLWLLYAVGATAVFLLWWPCRALATRRHGQWWFRLL